MAQQLSPWLEGAYGWNFGEGGWNSGMDQNLLKFSFMFDRNVDSIVASLPAAVNGQAHYLTTDNRLYFAVGTTYFSTVVPKWFTIVVRATGATWQFNGTSLVQIDSPAEIDARLDAVELTVASLGTAAFEDVEFFATQAELDVAEAAAAAYTDDSLDTFEAELLTSVGTSKIGAAEGGTVANKLQFVTPEQFGAFSETTFIQAIDTGKTVLIGAANTAVTLTTGANIDKFRAAYSRILVLGELSVSMGAGQHAMTDQWLAKSANNAKIKLVGAAPIETTLTSLASVTGSAGAWSVTANVVSAAGITIGDVVLVRNVTPGVQQPGTYSGQPVRGALQLGFFQMGELTTSGTSCTLSGASADVFMASGDLIVVGGTVRRIIGAPSPSAFTIDIALPHEVTGRQYWYFMKGSGQGTVTVSGNTVTGVGTLFTSSRIQPGDNIVVNRAGVRRVVSIESDTSLTVDKAGMDVVAASVWGAVTPGELHEGAWVVTNVVGNAVTWTHTGRESYAPPLHNINGGNVSCLKTILTFGTNNGFVVDGNALDINQVGLIGADGTSNSGFDLRGESFRPGSAKLGTKVGVSGFDYGVRVATGGALYAVSAHFSGQFIRGIDTAEGGQANLSSAVVTGSGGIGVFMGTGCPVRISDARILGHAAQGVRMEVGASTWADFSIVGNNIGDNFLCVGGVTVHYVGMRSFNSGGAGISGQNGGYGRGSGATMIGCGQAGHNWTHAQIEVNQTIVMGCLRGITSSRSRVAAEAASIGYNSSANYQLLNGGEVEALNASCLNSAIGISSTSVSRFIGIGLGFDGNTSDVTASEYSLIYIKGKVGGTTFTPALNTPAADGTLVSTI